MTLRYPPPRVNLTASQYLAQVRPKRLPGWTKIVCPHPAYHMARTYLVQEGLCALCQEPMAPLGEPCEKWVCPTEEHIIPKSKGGEWLGTVAAHQICNTAKGDRDPTEDELVFLQWVNDNTTPAIEAEACRIAIQHRDLGWDGIPDDVRQRVFGFIFV